MPLEHPTVQRVTAQLRALGALGEIVALPDAAPTAAAAATQLGCDVAAIANSLVFDADSEPLLVLASGGHRVDVHAVAALVGAQRVGKATADFVRQHTGMPIGGVAPVGHPEPLRTLIDVDLGDFPVVWAAAGHPYTVFPTSYDELLRITGGKPADVGA